MKKFRLIFPILLLVFSCTPVVKNIATWVNKEKVAAIKPVKHRVFFAVLTQNIEARFLLENDLANAATTRGIEAVKSLDVYANMVTAENRPTKEAILQKIRDLGCDAIFMTALTDQTSDTRYVPASGSVYAPYSTFGPYSTYGYFGSYYGYSSVYYSPGYYTTDKTYFLQSNMYETQTEELLISIQSKAVNPGDLEKDSKEYTAALVDELKKQGFLKGKK